jgi:hypothetical protein
MIDRVLLAHVLTPQHSLVRECLAARIFSPDDIRNRYNGDGGKPAEAIAHWYLVTDFLADQLIEVGHPVLRNEFGNWWGYVGKPPLTNARVTRFLSEVAQRQK